LSLIINDLKGGLNDKEELRQAVQEKAREIRKLKITVEAYKEKELFARLNVDQNDKENLSS